MITINIYVSEPVNVTVTNNPSIEGLALGLQDLKNMVGLVLKREGNIMHTLEEAKAEIEAQTTLVGGVKTLIQSLKDQVAAIPALTAEQQTMIDGIFDTAHANSTELTGLLTTGTPAANVAPDATGPAV